MPYRSNWISASAQAEFNDLQVKLNAPIGELLFGNLANLAFVIQDGEMGCSVKSTSEGIQISVTAKILGNRDDILDNVYVGLSILIKKQDDGSTLLDYESYAECYDFFVKVASQPEEDLKDIMVYAFIGILGLTGAYAGLDIIGLITGFFPELWALIPIPA